MHQHGSTAYSKNQWPSNNFTKLNKKHPPRVLYQHSRSNPAKTVRIGLGVFKMIDN